MPELPGGPWGPDDGPFIPRKYFIPIIVMLTLVLGIIFRDQLTLTPIEKEDPDYVACLELGLGEEICTTLIVKQGDVLLDENGAIKNSSNCEYKPVVLCRTSNMPEAGNSCNRKYKPFTGGYNFEKVTADLGGVSTTIIQYCDSDNTYKPGCVTVDIVESGATKRIQKVKFFVSQIGTQEINCLNPTETGVLAGEFCKGRVEVLEFPRVPKTNIFTFADANSRCPAN